MCVLALLLMTLGAEKFPVPSPSQLAEVRQAVAKEYAEATTSEMLAASSGRGLTLPTRFWLRVVAADRAIKDAEFDALVQAVALLQKGYDVPWDLAYRYACRVAGKAKSKEDWALVGMLALQLAAQEPSDRAYQLLVDLAKQAARRSRAPALKQAIATAEQAFKLRQMVHAELDKAYKALEVNPEDPDNNYLIGSFLALEQQEWARAMPHLRLATNHPEVAAAAKQDTVPLPNSWKQRQALAHAWVVVATKYDARYAARAVWMLSRAQYSHGNPPAKVLEDEARAVAKRFRIARQQALRVGDREYEASKAAKRQ